MRFFYFLFYKSYRLAIALGNEGFLPEVTAVGLATLLPWFNLLSILMLLEKNLIISSDVFKFCLLTSLVLLLLCFIYLIIYKRHFQIQSRQQKSFSENKLSDFLYYSYFLITCIIYFSLS